MSGNDPNLLTAGMRDAEPQTRAISSIIMTTANASAPSPPFSVGTWAAKRPLFKRASCASCG